MAQIRPAGITFFWLASAAVVAVIAVVAVCLIPSKKTPTAEPELRMTAIGYDALSGWADDDHTAALKTFLVSCTRMMTKPHTVLELERDAWLGVCDLAQRVPIDDTAAARAYFEQNFTPLELAFGDNRTGLLTGYFEPELRGSRERKPGFEHPLYRLPTDMINADLGAFAQDLAGRKVVGRLDGASYVPYYARDEIASGVLSGQGLELLWVDDAVDAFFLEIQGSGRVVLENGALVRVGYAGKNGRAYTAIGRTLIDRGALTKDTVSLFSIRDWLKANPDDAADVMNSNRSYVFFREQTESGPLGSEGVVLTPDRSLAVDRRVIAMGTPVWIETSLPQAAGGGQMDRLTIAQDTGGAITGALRGDMFWGPGERAELLAGHMKEQARFVILKPRALVVAE